DRIGFALGDPSVAASAQASIQCAVVEGRYPPVHDVIPKGRPLFTVDLDPALLVRVLEVAQAIAEPESKRVTLCYSGQGQVLAIMARTARGSPSDGLLSPREPPAGPRPPQTKQPEAEEPEEQAEKTALAADRTAEPWPNGQGWNV